MPAIVPRFSPLTAHARKAQLSLLVQTSSENGSEVDNLYATSTLEYGDEFDHTSNVPHSVSTASETPDWHEHQYSDFWPCGFHINEWFRIWTGEEHNIDPFLVYGINLCKGNLTPWFHEYEFKGIRWRLMIDHRLPRDDMPTFVEGMILNFQDCTNWSYRYIVDHCAYQDDVNAYLKIICYTHDRRACESWSQYPPILLAVPLYLSNVRMHPNTPRLVVDKVEVQIESPQHPSYLYRTVHKLRRITGSDTRKGIRQRIWNFVCFWNN